MRTLADIGVVRPSVVVLSVLVAHAPVGTGPAPASEHKAAAEGGALTEWMGMPGAWVIVQRAPRGEGWMGVVRLRHGKLEASVLRGKKVLEQHTPESEEAGKRWCEDRIVELARKEGVDGIRWQEGQGEVNREVGPCSVASEGEGQA